MSIKIFIFSIVVLALVSVLAFACLMPKKIEIKPDPAFVLASLVLNNESREHIFLEAFEEVKKELIFTEVDFLEVNLADMKIRVFQKGSLKKEVPILAKGDPQGWGGTAAGIYGIKAKYKNSFSVVADVYMPLSIHFYGKYYLHGEPYYPGGQPLISSVSGGCVRLADEDAQIIYSLAEIGMPVLVVDKPQDHYQYPEKEETDFPEVSAKSYLVADLDSGLVFSQKDAQEKRAIASLTKLMTAVVLAENIDLRKTILVEEKMLDAYGATTGLEKDKRFGVVELFYPLLIESSNDAAEVLSYFLGREKTIELMKQKAKSILMTDTEFTDPSGYDPGNISTAQDLFYLARYILNNRPPIFEITRSKRVTSFRTVSFDVENLWNKNVFVNDPTFVGGKTGFIKASRYTAIFIFRFTTADNVERNVVIILLGSDNEESDTQKIYQWLQENYFKEQE